MWLQPGHLAGVATDENNVLRAPYLAVECGNFAEFSRYIKSRA